MTRTKSWQSLLTPSPRHVCNSPGRAVRSSVLQDLRQQIEETLPYVTLNSEAAKREILIAPVLSRVAVICRRILRIEYPLKINEQLQGTLDYFLQSTHSLVVVEAKRDDLTRGFTQLAVELIALAMLEDAPEILYGAVTMGACVGLWHSGTQCTAGDARPCSPTPYQTMWKTWCGSSWGFWNNTCQLCLRLRGPMHRSGCGSGYSVTCVLPEVGRAKG